MPADSHPPDLHIVVLAAGKGTRMKSALPKVLHQAAGLPLIDRVLASAEPLAPESVVVVIGHQTEQLQAHSGWTRRPDRDTGAPARDRARAPSGGAIPEGEDGNGPPALRRRPAAAPRDRPGARQPPCRQTGGGDGPDRRRCPNPPATAASSEKMARFLRSSSTRTPLPTSGQSPRSTAASTLSTSRRSSRPCGRSGHRTPRGSTIFLI